MNTMQIFQQGQLAEAAYADFYLNGDIDINNIVHIKKALEDIGFSETQAKLFTDHWSVIAHQPNTSTGFSATLFQNNETGEQVNAIRGTEGGNLFSQEAWEDLVLTDGGDVVLDGLAIHQILDMYNDWQRLNSSGVYNVKVLEELETETWLLRLNALTPLTLFPYLDVLSEKGDVIIDRPSGRVYRITDSTSDVEFTDFRATGLGVVSGGTVTATGHSMGGHLAFAFSRLFGGEALGINGAGYGEGDAIKELNIKNLFQTLGGGSSFSGTNTNIYGELGPEGTSLVDGPVLYQQGITSPLFIEDALGNTFGHGKEQMTDSLAVADLFIQLSPDLQGEDITAVLNQITKLFEVSGNVRSGTLENTTTHLGALLGVDKTLLNPARDTRDDLYKLVDAIRKSQSYMLLTQDGVSFEVLAADAGQLESTAKTSDAVRYSLVTLTPFIMTGTAADAIYANHADDIKLFDADLDEGGMTDKYLEDRAKMLAAMISISQNDATLFAGDGSVTYEDMDSGVLISNQLDNLNNRNLDRSRNQQFIFGDEGNNNLLGGSKDDFLYGGLGHDLITGGDGKDYMEGGVGSDTYVAADGDIILDTDGMGRVLLDGFRLTGGTKETGYTSWVGPDKKTTYSLENGVLTVVTDKSTITIENFESENLGIVLSEEPEEPMVDKDFIGDDWFLGTGGITLYVTDELVMPYRCRRRTELHSQIE